MSIVFLDNTRATAPELGIFALIIAFVLSLSQAFFGLAAARGAIYLIG
jgi:hypothetical protein